MNIKTRLIAISLVAAIGAAFTACSDSGSSGGSNSGSNGGSNGGGDNAADNSAAVVETLSSEELDQVAKHDLEFKVYDPNEQGVKQDAVEAADDGQTGNAGADGDNANAQQGGDNANAQNGDNNANAQNGDNNANAQNGDNNANAQNGNNNANAQNGNNNANARNGDNNANAQNGDNNANAQNNNNNSNNSSNQSGNNSSGAIQTPSDIGSNTVDLPEKTGLQVISGKELIAQAYWMDLSEQADKVFNGEYLKAQFKIKEDAQDGIYPITIKKADFSNWGDPNPQTVKFVQIDGAVVVGGEAEENQFTDSTEPQILVSNVSGKAGDTVTVIFKVKNNPGVVGNILNFSFNGDALEYLGGESGADFDGRFS